MSTIRVDTLETLDEQYSVDVARLSEMEGEKAKVQTFDTVADMSADDSLVPGLFAQTLGYFEVGDNGANLYEIVETEEPADGGEFIAITGTAYTAQGLFPHGVNVVQFGATSDNEDSTAQFDQAAGYAQKYAADAGGNKGPVVHVPIGTFRVETPLTNKATWIMQAGSSVSGGGGVAPTFAQDWSNLTGQMIFTNGVSQSETLRVGTPDYVVQRYTGKSYSAALAGTSGTASCGVTGLTYSSSSDTAAQSCIGGTFVALNDDLVNDSTVWALYLESVRDTDAVGNTFGMESTSFNRGSVKNDTPNQGVGYGDGLTYNLWLTTGGVVDGVEDCNNSTGAIGILGKSGAAYQRGIVFKENSVETREAVVMPDRYELSWYGSSTDGSLDTTKTSYVYSDGPLIQLRTLNSAETDYEGVRVTNTNFSPMNDNVFNLGTPDFRWDDIYATSGTISTSDEREKTDLEDLSEAEMLVAQELKTLVKKFKWKTAVESKGDDARWHVGVGAQSVREAFEKYGLDGYNYGCLCRDEWTDEDGVSHYRMGVRADQILYFIISAL